jgi:hypothetical protein
LNDPSFFNIRLDVETGEFRSAAVAAVLEADCIFYSFWSSGLWVTFPPVKTLFSKSPSLILPSGKTILPYPC